MSILIERSGLLVVVHGLAPQMAESLQAQLQYTYHSMEPNGRGGMKAVSEVRRLWAMRDDGSLLTDCGFVSRIHSTVEAMGGQVTRYDRVDRPPIELHPRLDLVDASTWREGQVQMLSTFAGHEGGLIVSPTGSGKSYGMREICAMYPDARIVITAPGVDAVATVARYVRERLPGQVGQMGGGRRSTKRITVATFNSLTKVDYFNEIDILIADEVHRAPAKTYAEAIGAMSSPYKRFGFTATPEGRSDKSELVNEGLFGPILVDIPYYEAVERGEVVPIHCIVHEHWNGPNPELLASIKNIVRRDKRALWRNEHRNRMIADDISQILTANPDTQILVLVAKVEHLYNLLQIMQPMGFEAVTGNLTKKDVHKYQKRGVPITYHAITNIRKRDWQRREFEQGRLRRVIATEVWSQSVSANECSVTYFASGSGASIACLQTLGRASRVDDDRGKTLGTVIVPRDMFYKGYQARSDKLIRAIRKQGHQITTVK